MHPDREAAIRAALAELRAEYRELVPAQLRELEDCIAQARRGEGGAAALALARTLAHRVRGTAGSYGWPAVGEAAGRIEDALEAAGEALGEEAAAGIAQALADARAALAAG